MNLDKSSLVNMPDIDKVFPTPVEFFDMMPRTDRLKLDDLPACFSLLDLIREILLDQNVRKDHVIDFLELMAFFDKIWKQQFAIRYVLFQSIVLNIIFAPDVILNPSILDPIPLLLRLVVDTRIRRYLTLRGIPPFGRRELMLGLMDIYISPCVSITEPEPIIHNFEFHIFVSTLYRSGVITKPTFFVRAMIDALETSWDDASRLLLALYAVHWWVMNFGFRLFKQNGNEKWIFPKFVRHGDLYNDHIIRTFGRNRPRAGLTVYRWRYWKQRLEESMIDVVNIESNYLLSGPNNIARQAAEKIGRILLKNGYEV